MINLLQPKKTFIPRPAESEEVIQARWKKKKERIAILSENIKRLKINVTKVLKEYINE